MDMLIKRS